MEKFVEEFKASIGKSIKNGTVEVCFLSICRYVIYKTVWRRCSSDPAHIEFYALWNDNYGYVQKMFHNPEKQSGIAWEEENEKVDSILAELINIQSAPLLREYVKEDIDIMVKHMKNKEAFVMDDLDIAKHALLCKMVVGCSKKSGTVALKDNVNNAFRIYDTVRYKIAGERIHPLDLRVDQQQKPE